jgi:PASTA domain
MPDATPGTVDLFGKKIKTKTLAVSAGGLVIGVIGIGWYRNKQAAASAASANAATTSANDIDPATGLPAGSPQDEAALAGMSEGAYGTTGDLGAGQIIGYDGDGNPIYGAGTTNSPTGFANNAEWGQAVESYMGSSGSDAIAAAIGKYLSGQPLTDAQVQIVEEAIAVENPPPVAGVNGNPPGYLTAQPTSGTPGGGTGTSTAKVTVPNVVGQRGETAKAKLSAVGLEPQQVPAETPKGKTTTVTSTDPKAGTKVGKGSTVSVAVKTN